MRSVQKVSSHLRDIYWRRYKIQETLYIGQQLLSPFQSRHLGTSHSSDLHRLPCHISWISLTVWNLTPFKGDLVLGKDRSRRMPNLGCIWAESPGWLDVSPKTSAQDIMHEQAHCCDDAANHRLPKAVAFWIWIVSVEQCSSLT